MRIGRNISKKGIEITRHSFINEKDSSLLLNDPIVKDWYDKAKIREKYIHGNPLKKLYRAAKALLGGSKSTYLDANGNLVSRSDEHVYTMIQNRNGKPTYIQKTTSEGDAVVIKILDESGVETHMKHGPGIDEKITKNPETGKILETSQKSHDFKVDLQ